MTFFHLIEYSLSILVHLLFSSVPMSDGTDKAWKKTEDIPRRFDELPPAPGWVPVADVIRTQREEEARQEAQKIKIMPPMDSDSENETPRKKDVKEKKPPMHKKNENVKKQETPKKIIDVPESPTVDDVTQSMVAWALKTDYYPRKAPRHPSSHREHDKPAGEHKPPHFGLDKGHNKSHPSRPSTGDTKKHGVPHSNHHTRPDVLSPQKIQGYPSGASRTRPHQTASSHKERTPVYDEPSPDYDTEDYNAHYSRFQDAQWEEYYYDEPGYEGAEDPYIYDVGPQQYDPQYVYDDAPEDFGYEYGMPLDPYDDPRAYPGPSPPQYSQMPREMPRSNPRSHYDVLY